MIRISTANGKLNYETITEAEDIYLGQVISIDGAENVVLSEEPILNGSKREYGTHMTIADAAWEAVQEAVKGSAE